MQFLSMLTLICNRPQWRVDISWLSLCNWQTYGFISSLVSWNLATHCYNSYVRFNFYFFSLFSNWRPFCFSFTANCCFCFFVLCCCVLVLDQCNFIYFSCIFILLSRESDQCAIRARLGVARHLSTTPWWGNPAKCLPNCATSKLAGLFSTLSLQCWTSSREAVNTNVKIIGLTRLGIKPESTAQETDAPYHSAIWNNNKWLRNNNNSKWLSLLLLAWCSLHLPVSYWYLVLHRFML